MNGYDVVRVAQAWCVSVIVDIRMYPFPSVPTQFHPLYWVVFVDCLPLIAPVDRLVDSNLSSVTFIARELTLA